ncbi:MAG: T9SS type A sorting domain-containing protein [Bacteroidales bacterium]|nr:T9SS type A sorting domain-containing protein [Bacteroidales bacterium]
MWSSFQLNGITDYQLNLSNEKSGLYLIRIQTNNTNEVIKIVVK